MFIEALQLLWFCLPGGFANMAPVLANHIPALKPLGIPIDAGKSFRGRRIFGDHKTLRGFVAGWIMAAAVLLVQYGLFTQFEAVRNFTLFDYDQINLMALSLALGVGALAGDAVKSFFKRQFDIAPGKSWFPFDQIDFVIGGLVGLEFIVDLSQRQILLGVLLALVFHPTVNLIGWILRLKDNPF